MLNYLMIVMGIIISLSMYYSLGILLLLLLERSFLGFFTLTNVKKDERAIISIIKKVYVSSIINFMTYTLIGYFIIFTYGSLSTYFLLTVYFSTIFSLCIILCLYKARNSKNKLDITTKRRTTSKNNFDISIKTK